MIRINVESGQPFSGWAGPEDGPAEAFTSWLQLLAILARLVPAAASAAPAGRLRGHLDPGAEPELGQDV